MLRRRNIETASSPAAGGRPRPSFRWQDWQPRALNTGPNPSEETVELGDDTHNLRKIPSPTLKSSCRSKRMLAEGCENAELFSGLNDVACPPGRDSSAGSDAHDPMPAARTVDRIAAESAASPGFIS